MGKCPRIGVLVGSAFHPNVETVSINIAKLLGQNFKLEMVTNVQVSDKIKDYYKIFNYVTKPSTSMAINLFKDLINCYKYTISEKPDLLFHIRMPNLHGLIISVIGKIFNIPVIVRYTGEIFLHYKLTNNPYKKLKYFLLHNTLSRLPFLLADRVIVLGSKLKKDLIAYKINEEKIVVLPQPVDTSKFFKPHNKKAYKNEIGVNNEKVILFVGRLHFLKGCKTLLSVIKRVITRRNDIVFFIIGDGPLINDFENLNPKYVRVLRNVERDKIDVYYKAADLFIFPSLLEGTPNVVLEALSCGVPVIASKAGEIPNLISNICSSEEDYVNHILYGNFTIDQLPKEFNWEILKKKYTNLFGQLISHSRRTKLS